MSEYCFDEFKKLVARVWKDRESGRHGWLTYNSPFGSDLPNYYITVEPNEESNDDYLNIWLVDDVDSLYYPCGNIHREFIYDAETTEHSLKSAFNYLMEPVIRRDKKRRKEFCIN